MTIEEKREKNRLKNQQWREKDRERYNRNMNKWRANNPTKVVQYKLKERYNITPDQYAEMFVRQNGLCAICGKKEIARHSRSNEVQKLAVDHCHTTGKIRGLLCQDCNRGIGNFHDDITRLTKAIEYLKRCSV